MFDEHFEIFLADTPDSKAIHYSIRYQVYCEEMGFEDKENFPLEQESDSYDNDAVHFIVRHKLSKCWVGAMRLIHKTQRPLPLEKHAQWDLLPPEIAPGTAVELSRLCVIKEMRRGAGVDIDPPNNIPPEGETDTQAANVHPLQNQQVISRKITWGLLHAASVYCYRHNINHWYFLTTNALAKILRKGGLILDLVGEACNFRGQRYPFKVDVDGAYHSDVWEIGYDIGYKLFSKQAAQLKVA